MLHISYAAVCCSSVGAAVGTHDGGMPLPRENLSVEHLAAQSRIQQSPTILLHARVRFKHLQLLWVYSVVSLASHLHIHVTQYCAVLV